MPRPLTLFYFGSAFFCGCLLPLAANAQLAAEPQSIPSPNASSLGLYGQVPVSQFTGVPDIQIPLYVVQEGSLKVPVSLSYHASGFRPDVHPGWVGVGWNLNAGGVITRTVQNAPDEQTWPGNGTSATYNNGGFLYNFVNQYVNGANWEQTSAQLGLIDEAGINGNYRGFRWDTEPDEFSFNFGGYSGKFYWSTTGNGSTTGKWRVQCDKPVQIRILNEAGPLLDVPFIAPARSTFDAVQYGVGYPKTLKGFVVTTEDGTQYQFGGVTTAIEYELPFFQQDGGTPWHAISWYLTKITSSEGRQISFNYSAETGRTFINQMYFTYAVANINSESTSSFHPLSPQPYCNGSVGGDASFQGKLIRPVYLSSITWSNNTLNFASTYTSELRYPLNIYSIAYRNAGSSRFLPFLEGDIYNTATQPWTLYNSSSVSSGALANLKWRKLTDIQSYCNGQLTQRFDFSYTDDASQRLVLTQLKEMGRDNTTALKPPHVFSYNNPSIFTLPYLSFKTDHWGFYNGRSSSFADMPQSDATRTFASYYQARQPTNDPITYLSGVLTKIQYPTGGSTTFDYEQHFYAKQVGLDRSQAPTSLSANAPAGGLRIKKITSSATNGSSPNNFDLIKRYYYGLEYSAVNGTSSLSSGILGGQIQYSNPTYTVRASNDARLTYTETLFSVQSTLPACTIGQGSHIGYSAVTEQLSDGSYTTSRFSNFDTGNVDEMPTATLQLTQTPYQPYSSREHERGKILQESVYNNTGSLVKQKNIHFTAYNKDNEYARVVQASYFNVCAGSATSVYNGVSFRHYTYAYLPDQISETVYDLSGGNPITTTNTLSYNLLAPDFNSRLVASETTTNSKGQLASTYYVYPFDIVYPPYQSAPTEQTASTMLAMVGKNMIGNPVETRRVTAEKQADGSFKRRLIDAEAHTFQWGGVGNGSILPFKTYKYTFAQPIDPSMFTSISYGTASSPLIIDGKLSPKVTFDSFDAKGNVLGLTTQGAQKAAYLWGYKNTLLIAKVDNATPNEIFHSNFEEGTGWDTSLTYDTQKPRSGLTAGLLSSSMNVGAQYHSFSTTPLTIAPTNTKKFVLSGWVYSEGPTGQLWLFMYQAGRTGYDYTKVDNVSINTADINKWVYIQKVIDIPINQGIVTLNCRLTNWYRQVNADQPNKTGGRVWFDDVRIYPADAQMTTFTHSPSIGVTSISDANNKPVLYEYDGLNRLILVRDFEGNIVKQYIYNYNYKI